MNLITKTYTCEIIETMEQLTPTVRVNSRKLNIQTLALPMIVLPDGTRSGGVFEPNQAPKGLAVGTEVNVAVTTSQDGHAVLDHFGFIEVT